jgi:4-hydroxy-4-methyl-2-oxoglutarate aldolase
LFQQSILSHDEGRINLNMSENPYSISPKEIADRYSKLYTAAVNDIFQERGMHHQWLGPEITCRTVDLRDQIIAGAAFTVQWIHDPLPDERVQPAAKMVEAYPRDGIVVVDAGADQISGFWGELATTVCMRNGVRGAVINGGAKDTGIIKTMGFPIFCKFSSPVDGFYRSRLRGWQIPIWINEIQIRPGDMIVGDNDGVLVVPREVAEEILVETERRVGEETQTRQLLNEGVSADEASKRTGRRDL